jgi:Domain of unknown function (DUF4062)
VEIRTPDQRVRVFVSSTLGELAEERRAVSRAIAALRLTPVLFEPGARPHPPRELGRLVRDDLATLLSERFTAAALPAAAVPARSRRPRPLPVDTTSLFGREEAIDEVTGLVSRPEVRLVTLTGPGGIGKTRLAMAAAQRLRGRFAAGSVFVPLAAVTQPEQVVGGIARAVGADLAGTGSPLEALVEQLGDGAWLLVLDNLERVVEVAGDLAEMLARCPGVAILATSVTALGLRAEQEYVVPPLPLPADPSMMGVDALAASPAVALFVDRARAVRHDFALTEGNAPAVVDIWGRPRACGGGLACGCGRCSGRGKPSWSPRSARHWGRTASIRCSPPAAGSTANRRWRSSGTGAAPARGRPKR